MLVDYNIMFYYKVTNYKCNRWETLPLPSPDFFDNPRGGGCWEGLLDSHIISPKQ